MSISRRKFLRAGSVAALAAAVPLKSALRASGQGIRKELDGNPVDRLPNDLANSPLSYYTKSAFLSYLNSTFLVQAGIFGTIQVTLTQVRDTASGSAANQTGQECFSLLFQNGGGPGLPQGTYGIEHEALGPFALFLVPGGSDANGAQNYVAIVNRLADSPALFTARTRPVKTSTTPGPDEKRSTPVKATTAGPFTPLEIRVPKKRRQGEEGFDIISL